MNFSEFEDSYEDLAPIRGAVLEDARQRADGPQTDCGRR